MYSLNFWCIMAELSDFVEAPSEEFIDECTKEQLLKIAAHYKVDIPDKRLKDNVKSILKANLSAMGVLAVGSDQSLDPTNTAGLSPPLATGGLTIEQQKEMLMLQLQHDKMKHDAEIEKQLAVEKLRFQAELAKVALEQYKLDLIKSGKLRSDSSVGRESFSSCPVLTDERFDVSGNLQLLPKFCEKDPETFFVMFEHVADTMKWLESALALMLQCALTGRAQEAYSSLSSADIQNYLAIKSAVLKTYELVPEAYRQRFQTWRKGDKQTHLEFVRDLTAHFTCWCSALKVDTFEQLCDLIVLEQFKNSIPENVATYVGDHKVTTAAAGAALADDYVLTHRRSFGRFRALRASFGENADAVGAYSSVPSGKPELREADCYALKNKSRQNSPTGQMKGSCLAVPMPMLPAVDVASDGMQVKAVPSELETFLPFVSDGFVSLVGSGSKEPVKILRDTAAFDSFIQASVLPFSEKSDTGCSVPVGDGHESFAGSVAQCYAAL